MPTLQAQSEESINLQGYYFSDAYNYSILEDSGYERFAGSYVLTTSFAYVNTPLIVSDPSAENKVANYLDDLKIGTLGFTWYASNLISFGIDASYLSTAYSSGPPAGYGYEDRKGDTITGFGDLSLRAKLRLYRDVQRKMGLSFVPKIDFDTGKAEGFSTDESLRYSGQFVFEKFWDRLSILASAGYLTSSSARYRDIDYRKMFPLGLGASWKLDSTWNINAEVYKQIPVHGNSKNNTGDYYLTLKGKTFKVASVYAGAGIAGISDVDRDNWTVFAGLKFHAESTDAVIEKPKDSYIAPSRAEEKLLGNLVVTDRVYFDNSKSNIKKQEEQKINQVAKYLMDNEARLNKVVIEGYASKVGPAEFNKSISKLRAEEVLNYLQKKGVNPSILQIVFYGDDYQNEEKEHWMNRRVEFRVYAKE